MARLLLIAFDPADARGGARLAEALGIPFDILQLTGDPVTDAGAERVCLAGLAEAPPADGLAKALVPVCAEYSHVAMVSSMRCKDVLPRLAVHLDAPMVTDVIAVESPTVYKRPVVAGAAIEVVETLGEPVLLTFRPAAFGTAATSGASLVEAVSLNVESLARRVSVASHGKGGRPDPTQAKVVVSGGRPLKDAATFESVIGGLADALGGAVGATRAAVDSGIAPNEAQVGQTGKNVAPNLYVAAGVSGSTQHLAGMKDSKLIVAINTDPDAPIFEVADLGLVEDLFTAIPKIRQALGK
ncbi:MAG: FAD-binding protein [Fimbriimonadaceae bacterium]|nr:FAD-binding protein [Fimbriimonadaceae bacterium]